MQSFDAAQKEADAATKARKEADLPAKIDAGIALEAPTTQRIDDATKSGTKLAAATLSEAIANAALETARQDLKDKTDAAFSAQMRARDLMANANRTARGQLPLPPLSKSDLEDINFIAHLTPLNPDRDDPY